MNWFVDELGSSLLALILFVIFLVQLVFMLLKSIVKNKLKAAELKRLESTLLASEQRVQGIFKDVEQNRRRLVESMQRLETMAVDDVEKKSE